MTPELSIHYDIIQMQQQINELSNLIQDTKKIEEHNQRLLKIILKQLNSK